MILQVYGIDILDKPTRVRIEQDKHIPSEIFIGMADAIIADKDDEFPPHDGWTLIACWKHSAWLNVANTEDYDSIVHIRDEHGIVKEILVECYESK